MIIDDIPIVYPRVSQPDIMVAFSLEALTKYQNDLKEGAVLILDEDLVSSPEGTSFRIFRVPATQIAVSELGRGIVANMIMLGFLIGLTKVVSEEAMLKTIRINVPGGTEELNLTAFKRGMELAARYQNSDKNI